MYSILNESPAPITGLRSGVPMELERIVAKTMQKDRTNRYQHVDEIATDLRGLKQGVTAGIEKAAGLKGRAPAKKRTYVYVSLGVLAVMVAAVMMLFRPTADKIDSLAVLPLKNLSGDLEQEYFVEGMHDALIGELAQISALRVISRTSVIRYKGGSKAVPEIARELDVDAVVEGTVFRAGDSVRIQVQLIGARPERHLWAQSYERDLRNVLALHREVARTIAEQIRVKLTPQEAGRLASAHPVNPEAHEAYLKAKYYLNQFTAESLNKSMEQFQQAIAIDPNFAAAYSGLADAYVFSAMSHGTLLPREGFPKAREAAKRALEIDENLASAHVSLAQTEIFYYWDWSAAERELTRALELDPNNAQAHEVYYFYLTIIDREEEALAEIKRAQKLDPLSLIINADLGVALSLVGQYEQAIKQLQEVLKMNPNFPPALWALGNAYFLQEKYEESITWFQKAFASSGEHSAWLGPLGLACAEAGRKGKALEILEKMKKLYDNRQNISMAFIAGIHEVLGDKEQAFEWLEKAIEEHDVHAPWYKNYNMFKSMRSDPRFETLVKKMNLQE